MLYIFIIFPVGKQSADITCSFSDSGTGSCKFCNGYTVLENVQFGTFGTEHSVPNPTHSLQPNGHYFYNILEIVTVTSLIHGTTKLLFSF